MTEAVKPRDQNVLLWVAMTIFLLAIASIGLIWLSPITSSLPLEQLNSTNITQSVAVERVEKVAKLVSTETTLRDVIIYENTWYGSTKRSLVVVTGKVLGGINLDESSTVDIDDSAKTIAVTLPEPGVLGIEITELKTYDEQRGLWNPFKPSDRDVIFQLAREQLAKTSRELQITETARESAKELLESMFNANGYSVEVIYR
jgi:hypothetical protein